MAMDTSKIAAAADDLGDKLTKGGTAARNLGAEIVTAMSALDARDNALEARIAALEAGTSQPPIDQPPSGAGEGPSGGLISGFTSTPQQSFQIDGVGATVHGPGRPWSLTKVDDYTLRYEVRAGDHAWYDGGNVDRSEIQIHDRVNDNTDFTIAFRLMIEQSAPAPWALIGEWHNDDTVTGSSTSPPIAIELQSEKLAVIYRFMRPGSSNAQMVTAWVAPAKPAIGQWYVFEIAARTSQTSGKLNVKLDGSQIVDYAGPLGYGARGYWMSGIYRGATSSTFACQQRNLTGSWA